MLKQDGSVAICSLEDCYLNGNQLRQRCVLGK
jgi:hypothetical protein